MKAILELQDLEYTEDYGSLSLEEQKWYALAKEKLRTQTFDLLKPLNPLAIPKSRHTSCEICSKRATLQCLACRSHWCTHEHFLLDSESIHFFICPKLAEIWAMSFVPGKYESISDIVRGQTDTTVQLGMLKELCEIAAENARSYITNKRFLMAIAPTIRYVSLAEELYSVNSYEYIQANTLMVRAYLGLEKYAYVQNSLPHLKSGMYYLLMSTLTSMNYGKYRRKQELRNHQPHIVRDFGDVLISLQLAFLPIRIVAQMPKKIIILLSSIYHISGTLFADSNRFPEALDDYSHSAYLISLAYGPTSLEVTLAYYGIASVFIKKTQLELEKQASQSDLSVDESTSYKQVESIPCRDEAKAQLQASINKLIHRNREVQEKGQRPLTSGAIKAHSGEASLNTKVRPSTARHSHKPSKPKQAPMQRRAVLSVDNTDSFDSKQEHSSSSSTYNLKRFDRHIEESQFTLVGEPSTRFYKLGKDLKQGINMLRVIVDIWAIAIRRQLNKGRTLNFPDTELGDPKSMLQEIQAIYGLYLGEDTFEYGHVSLTLALFYTMYDQELDGYFQAKKAKGAFIAFLTTIVAERQNDPHVDIAKKYLAEVEDILHALSFFVKTGVRQPRQTEFKYDKKTRSLEHPIGLTATLGAL